jgi:hypothetical protein
MKFSRSKTKLKVMLTNKRKPRISSKWRNLANQKTTWKSLRPISMTLVIWSEHLEGLPLSQSFNWRLTTRCQGFNQWRKQLMIEISIM